MPDPVQSWPVAFTVVVPQLVQPPPQRAVVQPCSQPLARFESQLANAPVQLPKSQVPEPLQVAPLAFTMVLPQLVQAPPQSDVLQGFSQPLVRFPSQSENPPTQAP